MGSRSPRHLSVSEIINQRAQQAAIFAAANIVVLECPPPPGWRKWLQKAWSVAVEDCLMSEREAVKAVIACFEDQLRLAAKEEKVASSAALSAFLEAREDPFAVTLARRRMGKWRCGTSLQQYVDAVKKDVKIIQNVTDETIIFGFKEGLSAAMQTELDKAGRMPWKEMRQLAFLLAQTVKPGKVTPPKNNNQNRRKGVKQKRTPAIL